MTRSKSLTYADAGVDITTGNDFVEEIKPVAQSTMRAGVIEGLGGFGAMFDLKAAGFNDPILVAATDGVGTKLRIAIDTGRLETIGIDLVAMCVNDLICQGAVPLFFLDYFATAKLDIKKASLIMAGIAQGCRESNVALIGGETAEMPGMYQNNDFDLAGFALGAMERNTGLPCGVSEGDILIGLPSSGVHSNGFSLVRKIVENSNITWSDPCPFSKGSLAQNLLKPTNIYVNSAIAAFTTRTLKALAHITGGGLSENLPRILPNGLGAEIDLSTWQVLPVFKWLINQGNMQESEALKTFNCGIGMVGVCAPKNAASLIKTFQETGVLAFEIGRVVRGNDVTYRGDLI